MIGLRQITVHAGGNLHHHHLIQQRMPAIVLQHANQRTQFRACQQTNRQHHGDLVDTQTVTQPGAEHHQ